MEYSPQVIDLAKKLGKTPEEVAPLVGIPAPEKPVVAWSDNVTHYPPPEPANPVPDPDDGRPESNVAGLVAELQVLIAALSAPVPSGQLDLAGEMYEMLYNVVAELCPNAYPLLARVRETEKAFAEGEADEPGDEPVERPRRKRGRSAKRRRAQTAGSAVSEDGAA